MHDLKFIVLGAAAGGGLPQWNCGCPNCEGARRGTLSPQTQSSVALSINGENWAILNASPDIRSQIERQPVLHPRSLRHTPIQAVLITNAEVDHIAGLLTLREGQAFDLLCSQYVSKVIDENPIFRVLPSVVDRKTVETEIGVELLEGVRATLFTVSGKEPLFMEGADAGITGDEHTVGIEIRSGSWRAYYIPGCREITSELTARIDGADVIFFDGTVFRDDDLIRMGVGTKSGHRMGHVAMVGPQGSLERLAGLDIGQKLFIHINNTNPIWQDGPERRMVLESGWRIAHDGMEILLGT